MGAALTLGVRRIWYALESPDDGAHALLEQWSPRSPQPFFAPPVEVLGGVRRDESVALFAAYADGDGPAGMRAWARSLCP
jgi:tRNA(adenine34) deaminase